MDVVHRQPNRPTTFSYPAAKTIPAPTMVRLRTHDNQGPVIKRLNLTRHRKPCKGYYKKFALMRHGNMIKLVTEKTKKKKHHQRVLKTYFATIDIT